MTQVINSCPPRTYLSASVASEKEATSGNGYTNFTCSHDKHVALRASYASSLGPHTLVATSGNGYTNFTCSHDKHVALCYQVMLS
jgi:hypothetical protein